MHMKRFRVHGSRPVEGTAQVQVLFLFILTISVSLACVIPSPLSLDSIGVILAQIG
ncbi:hypothetical protein OMCYN_00159 [cyanobiont of Ornithocercus magnificus]|nr:hypothetical protein OMCYN_00159 [cyanobiont of Ornithocercus magnificus]